MFPWEVFRERRMKEIYSGEPEKSTGIERAKEQVAKLWEKTESKEKKIQKKAEEKERKILSRAEKEEAKEAARLKKGKTPRKEPPWRPVIEEVGNAVTHGVGAVLSIAGMILMLISATTPVHVLSAAVYGGCMLLMFLMSCLYHSFKWGTTVKRIWRRFDYISIYLLIGGTFTPLWLLFWSGNMGTILCIIQWVIIVTGITLIGVFGADKVRAIHMTMYIVLGWLGLVFLPKMFTEDMALFLYVLGGGVLYTIGIIPFALKRKGAHFIWHFFVLFGAAAHWCGIFLELYNGK